MADQKISALTVLASADATDVFPIVDVSATQTKKITFTALKSSLALVKADVGLGNVDNTTDLNKPISTATQTALDLKENSLGFTAEDVANKNTNPALGSSNTQYPSQNAVKTYVDGREVAILARRIAKNITGNITTDITTAVDIPGANIALAASEVWAFEFDLQVGCNNTGGIKFALTFPAGATCRAIVFGTAGGITSQTTQVLTTSGGLTGANYNTVNSQGGFLRISGTLVNGANAGNLQAQFASTVDTQTSTVYGTSVIRADRVS